MEEPIEIIQLPVEEWRRYREIRLEMLREEPQAFGSTYANMARRPPEFWQGRLAESAAGEASRMLFARDGDRLVGMIGAFYEHNGESAHIISVYVCKDRRGQRVGRALMAGILAEIGKRPGVRRADLEVNVEQAAAVGLYRGFGFEVSEELEEMQGDGQMHRGYRMEKRLPS